MNDDPVPISSVKHSYELVDAIRNRKRAGVTELARAVDRPKSTVHNHLRTLEQLGYVLKTDGKYRLSTRYFHIGWEARATHEVFEHGVDTVNRLEDETGRHVQLLVEEHGLGAILFATHWRRDDHTPAGGRLSLTRVHLHTNAPGKAILAQLPANRVASIVDRYGLPSRTERTITEERALYAELDAVDDRGYAIDREETISGSTGIGVAIGTGEQVYGAIAAYGPTSEIEPELERGELVSSVREHAETIRGDLVFGSAE